jgi:hypothetical protein
MFGCVSCVCRMLCRCVYVYICMLVCACVVVVVVVVVVYVYGVDGVGRGALLGVGRQAPGWDIVEYFDVTTRIWTTGPSLPTPRFGLSSETLGDLIYAIGGSAYQGALCMLVSGSCRSAPRATL